MRRLAALLSVALLAGCACTQVGCDNRLRFHTGIDLQLHAAYAVEACIDGSCSRAVLEQIGDAWDIEDGLTLRADEDNVELAIGDGDFSGTHGVTFTVRDASNAVLASFEGPIEFAKSEPNGGFCGPTCWSADIGP